MKARWTVQRDRAMTPVVLANRPGEWAAALVFAAAACALVMGYHDWWRAKPYSIGTFNESLAHTAYYCLALAFAFGPLFRFGWIPARAVPVRRAFGIVAVACATLHGGLSLGPLWPKLGWEHFAVKHWVDFRTFQPQLI